LAVTPDCSKDTASSLEIAPASLPLLASRKIASLRDLPDFFNSLLATLPGPDNAGAGLLD
jgi:hypothetical protein